MPGFRGKPLDSLYIADHIGRRNPIQQSGDIEVGEAVVERHVGNAGESRAE